MAGKFQSTLKSIIEFLEEREAYLVVLGKALPAGVAIDVRATQGGVLVDSATEPADGAGRVSVVLTPEADASGAYVVTATAKVDGVVYSATTMLVVE